MKILAFVDIHGNVAALKKIIKKSKDADLLVCAGDISMFGRNLDILFSLLAKTKKPLLAIPGNHETNEKIKEICSLFKFVKNIHHKLYTKDNYIFWGHGGGGFSLRDIKFEKIAEKFKRSLKKEKSKIILVTHAPPYRTSLDKLNSGYHGCKSIRKFIEMIKPDLHICGHFHENAGKKDKIGKTIIINPGLYGKIIEI